MYGLVLQKSVTVPGVNSICHISHVTSDHVWFSDGFKNLILTNAIGDELQHLTDVFTAFTGVHTVNIDGDLIYIDRKYNISILCTENKLKTPLIKYTAPWEPQCVYSSPSTGDLLVGMRSYTNRSHIGKVVLYNSTGKIIQTIQHNSNTGQGLYSRPKYITENRNGDVIVSDHVGCVVVTDRDGNYRFSYTGPPPAHQLAPGGICTDPLSHILVCDGYTDSVQMLDQHGDLLSLIQTSIYGIEKPQCLSYDEKAHLLWVGTLVSHIVKIYSVVEWDSLTDTLVPTLPPVPQNLILSPSTLRTPQPASSQERPQLESTYPRTVLTAQITSTSTLVRPRSPLSQERVESIHPWTASPEACPSTRSTLKDVGHPYTQDIGELTYPWTAPPSSVTSAITLERLRPPLTQGKHQLESTYPWIPPAHMSSISTLEQLGSRSTQERPQLVSSHLSTTSPADVISTKQCIKFERDFDDLPSGSSKKISESPPPRKMRRLAQKGNIGDCKAFLIMHRKFTSMDQIDVLKSETFRSEFESTLRRIEYVDCNDICGSSVKHCSIGKIETCSEFSIQGIFEWTRSCSEKITEARDLKCKCFVSTFCVLITIKTRDVLAHVKVNELHFIVKHLMDFAIVSRNYILLSELVRLYAFHCDFQLDTLFMQTFKKINAVIVETILLSAKCMILRKYPILQQNSIQLSLCHDCENRKRMTIVLLFKDTIEITAITEERVMGKKLFTYNCTKPSDEAYQVFKSYATSHSKETLPIISDKEAREFFRRHSNLTMISASPYKSVGFSKGKHKTVEKPCILLLCLHKGFIPYGEFEFPSKIGDVEVDVQEGFCSFGNGDSLEMGGDIRRKGSKRVGTIGGFVNLPESKIGLITCAHVVLSQKELSEKKVDYFPEVETFINSAHSYKVCGKVIDAEFPKPEDSNLNPLEGSSVDAALIELTSSSSVAGFRTVTEEQLRSAGFQTDKPPKFQKEIVPLVNLPNLVSDSVLKYGAKTGLTLGCLFNECIHVRIPWDLTLSDIFGSSNPKNVTVYNQMEIEGIRGQFFDFGDSGSFVFCINQDETLSCIGMAIGFTSRGTCLVTPIENVLKSLKIPVTSKCIDIIPVETRLPSSVRISPETAILNAITQMQSNFDKIDKHFLEQKKNFQKEMLKQRNEMQKRLPKQHKDIIDIKRELTKSNDSSKNQHDT